MNIQKLGLFLGSLVLLVAAFFSGSNAGQLGATIDYYSSLNQSRLYNVNASLLTDITAIRTSVVGIASSTSMNGGTLALEGSATSSASTTITGYTGVAVGDFVLCGESTSTAEVSLTCDVTAANVVTAYKLNLGGGAATLATSTIYGTVYPRAKLGAPAALTTVTSTSN